MQEKAQPWIMPASSQLHMLEGHDLLFCKAWACRQTLLNPAGGFGKGSDFRSIQMGFRGACGSPWFENCRSSRFIVYGFRTWYGFKVFGGQWLQPWGTVLWSFGVRNLATARVCKL